MPEGCLVDFDDWEEHGMDDDKTENSEATTEQDTEHDEEE